MEFTSLELKLIHVSLQYMNANSDDHGMYYLWKAMGFLEDRDEWEEPNERQQRDSRCEQAMADILKKFD